MLPTLFDHLWQSTVCPSGGPADSGSAAQSGAGAAVPVVRRVGQIFGPGLSVDPRWEPDRKAEGAGAFQVHAGTRVLLVYALTIGKKGPKFKKSDGARNQG
jgi:hypothetical protein